MATSEETPMRQSGSAAERATLFDALWEYCKLDTLAMVRIHEVLRERVSDH